MSFPQDFLTSLEVYATLSEQQQKVFLCVFGEGSAWTNQKRAQHLFISDSNLRSCLTGIYKKFGAPKGGHGKESWLKTHLLRTFQAWQRSGVQTLPQEELDIDAVVADAREKIRDWIQEKCGSMRVLDMNQPIDLGDIYTDVNILEKPTASNRYDLDELFETCQITNKEAFERWGFGKIREERVRGLEAVSRHKRLMVLGKPGAGKTTFLKYLAIQAMNGTLEQGAKFVTDVPLFVTLKEFAETEPKPSLIEYLTQITQIEQEHLIPILSKGRSLILLDGLDEVLEADTKQVNQDIKNFAAQFGNNTILVTCRIAAKSYVFQNFTEVEVADFDELQVQTFVRKWFEARKKAKKADKFLDRLEDHAGVKELANSPLLLTLLCLIFEAKNKFYENRSELYAEGVELLLDKWDDSRDIERDEIYKNLSVKRRVDLLGKVAFDLFESGNYFFKQKQAASIIESYISNLPGVATHQADLEVDSRQILRSIQAQHGLLVERAVQIYSFSHLTFHEYFAAREVDQSARIDRLVEHLFDERWREVFLLAVGMSRQADLLILAIKRKVERLVVRNQVFQSILDKNFNKSYNICHKHKSSAVRAYYLCIDGGAHNRNFAGERALDLAFALDLKGTLDGVLYLDLTLERILDHARAFDYDLDPNHVLCLDRDLSPVIRESKELSQHELTIALEKIKTELAQILHEQSYDQLPVWRTKLQSVMIKHRNVGHNWKFTDHERKQLNDYLKANQLLVDCLNSDCYVSQEVRQEVEDTLLLPQTEIDRYYADRTPS